MTSHPDILCIGSVLWDIVGRAERDMRVGSDVAGKIRRVPGGVALNVAMAAQSYGLTPALLSCVGRDSDGDELVSACDAIGMVTQYLYRAADLPTDRYMAIESPDGLVAAIADAHSLENAGDKILDPFLRGALSGWSGLVAIDGNLTIALLDRIANSDAFKIADLRIAPASPGKAQRLVPFLTHPSATLYVNLEEAGLILNTRFDTSRDAAHAMVALGLHRALVTDGPRPVSLATQSVTLSKTPPQVRVSRITGAGDTFMAAHIAAEVEGQDDEASLDAALASAATYISGDTY